ncbi:MAG: tetratricopeptide repeat protein [Anaerolineae bacterium]|nr:tetratricopeptide repeat protein [Anaerolineae bacterium]
MTDVVQLQRRLRVALQNDDHAAAIDCLKEAAQLAHQAGDRAAEGRHLGNLALLYNRLGQPHDALRCFERALQLVRADGDRVTEDGLLGNMGNILRELRRFDEARDYLHAALQIAAEIGDVRGRGIWLSNLGLVHDDLGQPEQAIEYHSQSIVVARQLRDQRGLAARLRKLSDSFLSAGNPIEALKCLGEALTIYTDINDQQEMLDGLIAGAGIHSDLGRAAQTPPEARIYFQNALDYYRHALSLAHAQAKRTAEALVLARMGDVLLTTGDHTSALVHLQLAHQLCGELGMTEWQTAVAHSLQQLTQVK